MICAFNAQEICWHVYKDWISISSSSLSFTPKE
jgi:hypothetical protein